MFGGAAHGEHHLDDVELVPVLSRCRRRPGRRRDRACVLVLHHLERACRGSSRPSRSTGASVGGVIVIVGEHRPEPQRAPGVHHQAQATGRRSSRPRGSLRSASRVTSPPSLVLFPHTGIARRDASPRQRCDAERGPTVLRLAGRASRASRSALLRELRPRSPWRDHADTSQHRGRAS